MPAETQTANDTTTARDQATQTFDEVVQHARTPLLAALGAGDVAAQTMRDTLEKVRTQLNERAETARQDLPNDLNELRDKLDPAELRKLVDTYTESARQLYSYLAGRGEETWNRLQTEPRVQQVRDRVGTAQDKVDDAVGEVRDLADDVLGTVTPTNGSEEAAESDRSKESTDSKTKSTNSGKQSQAKSTNKTKSSTSTED